MAERLLGQLQPLWLKRHGLDLEVRFETGRTLLGELYSSDLERLPYGRQVMNRVSKGLGLCQPDLHRMVKFARTFKDLASFRAQHPDVTTWDGVKKVLPKTKAAQATSSSRNPKDPSKAIWQRIDKQLSALKADLTSVPQGSKKEDAEKREPIFQAVKEEFQKLLANGSVTSEVRVTVPSRKGRHKQLDSIPLSTAQ